MDEDLHPGEGEPDGASDDALLRGRASSGDISDRRPEDGFYSK